MFYYLYQITNLVNNKIYVGVHKTKNLNDGYMGSGKVINCAIEKHGINNFKKDILEYFDDSYAMYAREKEIVTDEFLLREDTYNVMRGGHGGFDYINKNNLGVTDYWKNNPELHIAGSIKGGNKTKELKVGLHDPNIKWVGWVNQEHQAAAILASKSQEARDKRINTFSEINHQSGEKNSQFATRWITNDIENKKIKKSDILPIGWKYGRVMKK